MKRLIAWAAIAFVGLVVDSTQVGCRLDSEILCGRWQTRPSDVSGEAASLVPGGMELYLGHYGPDVVGTIRFYNREFDDGDDCGINDPPTAGCGCTYITNGTWNEGKRRFTFRLDGAGETGAAEDACLPDAVDRSEVSSRRIEFDLNLSDDNTLQGSITWVGKSDPTQPVRLERLGCQSCDGVLGETCPQ